jgi:error-prone DNA polymerase
LRLGFRQAKGLAQDDIDKLVTARGDGYRSIADLGRRAGLPNTVLTKLAEADAFRSLELDRRQALWAVMPLEEKPLPLFADADLPASDDRVDLPLMPVSQHVIEDYRAMSLSLKRHPVAFLRTKLPVWSSSASGPAVPVASSSSPWKTNMASPTWSSGQISSSSIAALSWGRK